jgi:hypothetical protein
LRALTDALNGQYYCLSFGVNLPRNQKDIQGAAGRLLFSAWPELQNEFQSDSCSLRSGLPAYYLTLPPRKWSPDNVFLTSTTNGATKGTDRLQLELHAKKFRNGFSMLLLPILAFSKLLEQSQGCLVLAVQARVSGTNVHSQFSGSALFPRC